MVTTAKHLDTGGKTKRRQRRKESREEMVTTAKHLDTGGKTKRRQRRKRKKAERRW